MKKILIIFLLMIVLSLSLVLPSFAVMTDSFGSYTNLFDPSDVVQARFYIDSLNYQDNNFYLVDLQPFTYYTFISTNGSKRFYFGEMVYDSDNYPSVYSFDSLNLLNSSHFESGSRNGVTLTYEDGYLILNGTSTDSFSFTCYQDITFTDGGYISAHYISGSTSNRIYLSASNGTYNESCGLDTGDVFESKYFSYNSINLVYLWIDSGTTFNNFKFKVQVSDDYLDSYYDFYIDPVYVNSNLSVLTFGTGDLSNDTYIGINDILSGSTSNLFSSNQSSENEFYLIEGKLTVDQISEILDGNNYQNGYNSGFTQGYKEGEYDGMNSTSIFKSVILTVLSGPFVVVSNALNFEIFGINIYTFIQIILTILIVAFLITRLKGRE